MAELTPGKLRELTRKWLEGTLTPEESKLLDDWYNREAPSQVDWSSGDADEHALKERLFSNISKEMGTGAKVRTLWSGVWLKTAVAASVLLAISVGGYFLLHKQPVKQETDQLVKNDIAPGHNQATLTLANGKKIVLTKGLSGTLAQQGQTQIKVTDNNITYNAKTETDKQVTYNTLTTARGEQSPYPLVLADGTKVWLNAESSLTFPTAFNQKERIVRVTGEAYFEVAHNADHNFKVQTATQTIEDIGTRFDVNAYTNEPNTKTTLIEGSVKVNDLFLKPGEQTDGSHIKSVDTEVFTAWKEGNFHFEGDRIETVMRQLARWYDIEVSYQGKTTNQVFYADISRNRNISAVLKVLHNSQGVSFKVEGRRVTVIE